ncbi:MAG: DUF5615 family PIN-like protein [Phycisphaerales bacterium]
MKLLLDENVPEPLRRYIVGHEVFTVGYLGWKGVQNGELLRLAAEHGFEAMVTLDASIEYQRHHVELPITLLVLHCKSSDLDDVLPMVPLLLSALAARQRRGVIHVRSRSLLFGCPAGPRRVFLTV